MYCGVLGSVTVNSFDGAFENFFFFASINCGAEGAVVLLSVRNGIPSCTGPFSNKLISS
jgi:hypothetical protein